MTIKIDILEDFIIANYIAYRIEDINTLNKKISLDNHQSVFLLFLLTSLFYELKRGNTVIIIKDNFFEIIDSYIQNINELLNTDFDSCDINLLEYKQIILQKITTQTKLSNLSKLDGKHLNKLFLVFYDVLTNFNHKQLIIDCLNYFNTLFSKDNSPTPFIFKVLDNQITIWLYRSYHAEYTLAHKIFEFKRLQNITKTQDIDKFVDNAFTDKNQINKEQRTAIKQALQGNFTIITGGPGTGKTFTVAKIVTLLVQYFGVASDKIALVAPTGKASQRMQESLQNSLAQDGVDIELPKAMTIHRLLGANRSRGQKLAYDVIVVDEASMLGAELASAFLNAVDDDTRLILLGDIHQLSAVEAGAVLADLCQIDVLKDSHVHLVESRRFKEGSDVAKLAVLCNQQTVIKNNTSDTDVLSQNTIRPSDIVHLINTSDNLSLTALSDRRIFDKLSLPFFKFFEALKSYWFDKKTSDDCDSQILMTILNDYRILTATHHGEFGKNTINDRIKKSYFQFCIDNKLFIKKNSEWYHGRVVMITQNNYTLDLFNGDIGICLACKDGLFVFFDGKQTPFMVSVFDEKMVDTAYAMTIHKSQGSEFNRVAICLAGDDRLLGRELIYTAITRAKDFVDIYADSDTLAYAINKPVRRNTGLPIIFNHLDEKDIDIKYQNTRY